MSFEQLVTYLIENYGYLTILIWTFIEGETIVILAGMAVASGIGGFGLARFAQRLPQAFVRGCVTTVGFVSSAWLAFEAL